jgi:predicted transposase YbfD/YdcC
MSPSSLEQNDYRGTILPKFFTRDAQLNGRVIRQDWGIENQVHSTLDVTFNEDQ